MGYEVVLADDGAEAVAAYAAEKPDLVLLDVMMPRLNGLVACQPHRKVHPLRAERGLHGALDHLVASLGVEGVDHRGTLGRAERDLCSD